MRVSNHEERGNACLEPLGRGTRDHDSTQPDSAQAGDGRRWLGAGFVDIG